MMTRIVKAKIYFLPAQAGGRKTLPAGPRYSTVASFYDNNANSLDQAWSIIAEFSEQPDERCMIAEIRFLAPNAPLELLNPGIKFSLFEGPRLVATGEVLPQLESRKYYPIGRQNIVTRELVPIAA